MKFSVATLLATFTDDKLVAPKMLEKKLGCEDEVSLRQLQITLDALEKTGVVIKERGKYRRIQDIGYVEGRLRCSSKGFCFAIQDVEGAEDIYIQKVNLNHAWNGDRVLVEVTKEASRRRSPEGEVKLILDRANTSVLARVENRGDLFQAVPMDDRLVFQLDLQNEPSAMANAIDHLVNVEVVRYPIGQYAPMGTVTQVLGSDAEAAADIDIVCCKHSLPRSMPEAADRAAAALPTKVRKTDIKGRLDLRKQTTVAIQAMGANGLSDNAISLEQAGSGLWKLGIHVTDIDAYVAADSPIDQEARRRGTAIYLGETLLPLLPDALTQAVGNFAVGEERLAVSILITLTGTGEVVEYEIRPSVVKADYVMSYAEAQDILDRQASDEVLKIFGGVVDWVDQLMAIGLMLRKQRQQKGGFELHLPERWLLPTGEDEAESESQDLYSQFAFSDEGSQLAVVEAADLPLQSIITEVMILANRCVAQHLQGLGIPGLYRLQRSPKFNQVQELVKLVSNLGIEIELGEEEVLPQNYQEFAHQFADSKAERVLTYLLHQTLKMPTYSLTPGKHFALAIDDCYTHFVCPTRRYADLLVQRILKAVLNEGRDRKTTRSKETVDLGHSSSCGNISWNVLAPELQQELEIQVQTVVVQLSEREARAQEAEADLIGLKKAEYMKARTGEVFPGVITRVYSYGFFVEIEESLVEGLVHVSSLKDDWYEYRMRQQRLVGRKNRKQYRLGDRVQVQVKSVDYYRQQIDLMVISGGSESSADDFDDDYEGETEGESWDQDRDRDRDRDRDQRDQDEE